MLLKELKKYFYKINRLLYNNGGNEVYQFTMPKEVTASVKKLTATNKNTNSVEDLLKEIEKVNNKYKPYSDEITTPEKVDFEKLTFENKTDDEIKQESESSLANYKNQNINNINDEYLEKENTLKNSIEPLRKSAQEETQNLKELYNTARENTNNEAIKRGIAHSSIVFNQINAFNEQELEDYKKIDEELTNKINAINFELSALDSQKEEALNNFNIEYATKLNDKITELKNQLKEEEKEVIKYNNEIAAKEQQFNNDIAEFIENAKNDNFDKEKYLMELQSKYGVNVINNLKSQDIENVATTYFAGLTKDEVKVLLENEQVQTALGNSLVERLKKKYE